MLARDTANSAITKRILLVQDSEKKPGFLHLLPMYKKGLPITTVTERRAAFNGWIYAPFIGENFIKGLTTSQGNKFHLKIYDEGVDSPDTLIYNSNTENKNSKQSLVISCDVDIMQQKWKIVWTSTAEFEQSQASNEPLLVLITGLFLTGLFAVFVITVYARTRKHESEEVHSFSFLPLIVFCVAGFAVLLLKNQVI
ncbi:MAG: CHASE1-domain containing sensor protein [Alphaproteobacteria bacterium]|jgi:CHASE1-domain containing sensor protein